MYLKQLTVRHWKYLIFVYSPPFPQGQYFSMVDSHRVYLLGTAPIWWANLALLMLSGFIMVYIAYRETRGERGEDAQAPERQRNGQSTERGRGNRAGTEDI